MAAVEKIEDAVSKIELWFGVQNGGGHRKRSLLEGWCDDHHGLERISEGVSVSRGRDMVNDVSLGLVYA